ncbi:Oidioi.mRNA.OKI2018_I69.PAR.g9683.t1.cds [Oikopleura dioica]|uniref:Oidioi.mRNA.OKI2018_I69.PAR.g9683.t1.cds n=1 Tax=Oikopleura dioica TaxID=34765 RepID=A0ABN7RQB0_OIKDI|nr:Oidioi.mRNA.OKI2018_I69.PAR.g9683.t1.cds [Oikopleura dioica]
MKLIGEIPMTRFEKYAFACQLGREPAINFVNSTLVTNDRVYVLLRLILGLTSIMRLTWVGSSTPFRGLNYPIAVILTIYTNFNRKKIILGFGSKMQTLNKIHSLFFNCQIILSLFIAITNGTKWLGFFPYRDMSRRWPDMTTIMMIAKEFVPLIFLLVEILWFDTKVSFAGCWHGIISTAIVVLAVFAGAKQTPQNIV